MTDLSGRISRWLSSRWVPIKQSRISESHPTSFWPSSCPSIHRCSVTRRGRTGRANLTELVKRIEMYRVDEPDRSLKVATRVRIPLGLQKERPVQGPYRSTMCADASGVDGPLRPFRSVTSIRCRPMAPNGWTVEERCPSMEAVLRWTGTRWCRKRERSRDGACLRWQSAR
jgi:hypothetical protein